MTQTALADKLCVHRGVVNKWINGVRYPKIDDAARIADISTAPAAVSFASLARGFRSSVTRSTTASMEVFTISRLMTSAKRIRQMHHSVTDILQTIPARTTMTAMVI